MNLGLSFNPNSLGANKIVLLDFYPRRLTDTLARPLIKSRDVSQLLRKTDITNVFGDRNSLLTEGQAVDPNSFINKSISALELNSAPRI